MPHVGYARRLTQGQALHRTGILKVASGLVADGAGARTCRAARDQALHRTGVLNVASTLVADGAGAKKSRVARDQVHLQDAEAANHEPFSHP